MTPYHCAYLRSAMLEFLSKSRTLAELSAEFPSVPEVRRALNVLLRDGDAVHLAGDLFQSAESCTVSIEKIAAAARARAAQALEPGTLDWRSGAELQSAWTAA